MHFRHTVAAMPESLDAGDTVTTARRVMLACARTLRTWTAPRLRFAGTVRLLSGTVRLLYATVRLLYATVRLLYREAALRYREAVARYCATFL
jgi:hypothetical protein